MENILCGKCGKASDDLCEGCGQCPECHFDLQNVAATMFMKMYEDETLSDTIAAMADGVKAVKTITGDDSMDMVDAILSLIRLYVVKLVDGDGEEEIVDDKHTELFASFIKSLEEDESG